MAVAVAVAVLVSVVVGAWPAWAHAFLVRTDPAQGARLDRPPEDVALQFSEPVDPSSVVVEVGSATGVQVAAGDPRLSSGGRVVRAPLPADDDGVFVVSWQVVSAVDGHETWGEFAFAAGDIDGTEGLVATLAGGGLLVAAAGAAWPLLSAERPLRRPAGGHRRRPR